MKEILWHGRGGQGAFTAAKILGAAYSLQGNYALAFPSFGPERRGAPILSFTKLDSKAIGDRSQIKKADYVIYLDDTLFSSKAFDELKDKVKIFLNTKKSLSQLAQDFTNFDEEAVVPFDAEKIAYEVLGLPVTNTVMLSLLVKETSLLSEESLLQAIKEYLPAKISEKNLRLVEKIFSTKGGSV